MKNIFISFSGEDAKLAEFFSRTLNHIFTGFARFFASSGGLEPGSVWLERIRHEVHAADMVLILLNPRSFERPWINIETGAFWAGGKTIYPLLHGGLNPGDLHRPLSDYQAINIGSPGGIASLIGVLASRVDLPAPPLYDAYQLYEEVKVLSRGAMKLFDTWPELAKALDISDGQPEAEPLHLYQISKEINGSNYRVLRERTAELSGYSTDSLLFTFRSPDPLPDRHYLVISCSNTAATTSLEYGLFMKVVLDQEVLLPHFPYHRHSRDDQFTGKGDGYFPYDISSAPIGVTVPLLIVLWRANVDRLRLQFFYV